MNAAEIDDVISLVICFVPFAMALIFAVWLVWPDGGE